jgi:hypothetical protein
LKKIASRKNADAANLLGPSQVAGLHWDCEFRFIIAAYD